MTTEQRQWQRTLSSLKAAITRAKNNGDAAGVIAATDAAVDYMNEAGWPDNWPMFRLAVDDLAWSDNDAVRRAALACIARF